MTEHVNMADFIAAKSDQMNADDLMDAPRTITVTKVTAAPDAAEQPVSIHYEGDQGKPFKPCKTMRRILVGVWGKDASKYVGRSMTLYRDATVAFGGLQVGGIRISHMSDIAEDKTVALLVTRGRKAPFKIRPLVVQTSAPTDFSAQLAELKAIAKPGNMDALGAAWKEIGADARKALASELPALKAACAVGVAAFDAETGEIDETSPAEATVAAYIERAKAAETTKQLVKIVAEAEPHKEALGDELAMKLEIGFDRERNRIEASEGVSA